mgnify:CR=1 FL=1
MDLINGDCLEAMKDLSDNSIDLLFCDLPYGQTQCKWDTTISLELFWKEVNRICKMTTPMFFTCSTKFGVSLINSNPKNFRYDLVWKKSTISGFLLSKKQPLRSHEMVYVFYRKQPFYDLSSHTRKYEPPLPCGVSDEPDDLVTEVYRDGLKQAYSAQDRKTNVYEPPLPNTILDVKSVKGKHSTQKPTELIKWILKYYSKEGDTILDPTMGSGTTGVACKEMNRRFIGIELNQKFFDIAKDRINS